MSKFRVNKSLVPKTLKISINTESKIEKTTNPATAYKTILGFVLKGLNSVCP